MFTQFICKIVRALDQKLGRSNPAGTMIRDFDVTEIDSRVPFPSSLSCNAVQNKDQIITEFPLTGRDYSNSSTSCPLIRR